MKTEALHTLVTARVLFDSAHRLCTVDDKHAASAGLVVLQDAVELIFYACLIEKESDEKGALERLSFDQLIGELKKAKVRVKKSGTLPTTRRYPNAVNDDRRQNVDPILGPQADFIESAADPVAFGYQISTKNRLVYNA